MAGDPDGANSSTADHAIGMTNIHQRVAKATGGGDDVEAGNSTAALQGPIDAKHHHRANGSAADATSSTAQPEEQDQLAQVTYADIFKQFSLLGWTAFGGPAAHIGLFQRVGWLAGDAPVTTACRPCRCHHTVQPSLMLTL